MKKKTTGFTLVELMVTLSVAGILLAIAVPSYRTMVQNNRLAAGANEFISSIESGPQRSTKRRTNITATDNMVASISWILSISAPAQRSRAVKLKYSENRQDQHRQQLYLSLTA